MAVLKSADFELYENPNASPAAPYDADGRTEILSERAFEIAKREISSWTGYRETPLRSLSGLARALNIGQIFYKDEGGRFGLGSFKALGFPVKMSDTPQQVRFPPPLINEHGDEIRRELAEKGLLPAARAAAE